MQNITEIDELIRLISKLPGLGPKSAKRIVLKLINNRNEIIKPMANTLVQVYKNVTRWAEQLYERPPVQRGRMVNRARGDAKYSVPERHSMADFEGKMPEPL